MIVKVVTQKGSHNFIKNRKRMYITDNKYPYDKNNSGRQEVDFI